MEWIEKRQSLVQPLPNEYYKLPDGIDSSALDREFDQLFTELESFSLEEHWLSEEFGLDAGILAKRIQAAEKDVKERLSLEKDVAGFVNKLTDNFISPEKNKAATHFITCMEEFRRIAKALPKSEFSRNLIKKALNKLADQMDFLTAEVRKHCIRQTYRHLEKDKVMDRCSTEEQKNQVQAVQDLMAFEEYQLDINAIVSEVVDPSQPGDSSDEGEGEEALSGSDHAQMKQEAAIKAKEIKAKEIKAKEWSERKAREDENFQIAITSLDDITRQIQELEARRKKEASDRLNPWQKLVEKKEQEALEKEKILPSPSTVSVPARPIPSPKSIEKREDNAPKPVPSSVMPYAHLYPALDGIKDRDGKPEDSSLPPPSITLQPTPSVPVEPVKAKEITKTNKKFKIIEQRKQEVADAQGEQDKMAEATKKMVFMADQVNKKVTERTRDIAKKPLSKDKVISKIGHLVDVRAIQDKIVPPGTRPCEVVTVNEAEPGKPANIHGTLVELLEQPVMRRFDSQSDASPDQVRSWSLQQLREKFEEKADRFSEPQRECIIKHLRTLKSFLGNKSYPFSYFRNMTTPVKLPEEPFGLIAQSLYDEWIGFPMVSHGDYAKIHAFDDSTLSRFLSEIFSETTMTVLESLFPNKAGIKGVISGKDLCSKPKDAFDVGCVTHTNDIRIAMLYSPSKRSHYLAVRERGKESVIRCKGKNTSEYLGGRRSTNIAYQSIKVPMIGDNGSSALAISKSNPLPYKPTF
ncbi:hypothetical protein [Endozoicomonas numazuensis]|uniref:hypothetical protein n=1 Tax=Endozoicomonas numazuensis TaxID=1137799 RepID=UPI00054DAC42|nr:hypothetical protein [Endozoicomonas numazuensis]